MLILGRKEQQGFYINGSEILVKVLKVEGNAVRIGVEAPRHISVYRKEICPQATVSTKDSSSHQLTETC